MAQNNTLEQANSDLKALQQISFENTRVGNPETLQEYINIAKMMAASGYYGDVKTAQQAVALMILGRHFGLSPVQSMTAIHIVKGKPMLHYSAILAKVREHPHYDYEIVEHTEKVAKIAFTHHGKPCGVSTFTIEDAKKQGTQNIEKLPKTMLLARATSNGVKWYCPDVLNGMPVYVQGEIPGDDDHADAGMTKRDQIRAELQAKIAEQDPSKAEAMIAEHRDVSDHPEAPAADADGVVQDSYSGPVVRAEEGQGALVE